MTAAEAVYRIWEFAVSTQGLKLIHQLAVMAIAVQPDHDAALLHPLAQLSFKGGGNRRESAHSAKICCSQTQFPKGSFSLISLSIDPTRQNIDV